MIEQREEQNERKDRALTRRNLPLDSAPSGRESTDDSEQALDLNPNHGDLSEGRGFGGGQQHSSDLASGPGPFRRAPDADRDNLPGYSWLPHLYQGLFKVEEKRASVNAGIRDEKAENKTSETKKTPGAFTPGASAYQVKVRIRSATRTA